MWSKVIDALLAELKRRTEPRARYAHAVRELHAALVNCHSTYTAYRSSTEYRKVRRDFRYRANESYYRAEATYRSAVLELIQCMWHLREVLPVFAPAVMKHLTRYTISELDGWVPSHELMEALGSQWHSDHERSERMFHLLSGYKYNPPTKPATAKELADPLLRLGKLTAWAWGCPDTRPVTPKYEDALALLQEYMREQFKPEELF